MERAREGHGESAYTALAVSLEFDEGSVAGQDGVAGQDTPRGDAGHQPRVGDHRHEVAARLAKVFQQSFAAEGV